MHISIMLVFWSLVFGVRNSVVLAVYLLFSVACFFTIHEHYVYACISFLRVKKKAELPVSYFVLTLGLPYPLESGRVVAKTEPYPGRWTTHIVVSEMSDLDEELFAWVEQAYMFSEKK